MERSACLLILLVGSARGQTETCTGHHQCPPLTYCLFNLSPRCVQCSVCRVFPNDDCETACDTLCAQDELRCEDARCVANSARCDGVAVSPPSALPCIREVAGHAAVVLDGPDPARLETIRSQSADLTKPDLDVIPGDCRPRDAVVRGGVGAHFRYRRPPGRGWVDTDLKRGTDGQWWGDPKVCRLRRKVFNLATGASPPPPHPPCHPAPVTVNIHPNYSALYPGTVIGPGISRTLNFRACLRTAPTVSSYRATEVRPSALVGTVGWSVELQNWGSQEVWLTD